MNRDSFIPYFSLRSISFFENVPYPIREYRFDIWLIFEFLALEEKKGWEKKNGSRSKAMMVIETKYRV